ncbi:MAG: ribose 5-phosphate isomerase B [Elusimicrobia bacterium]|nr:ribose 5-phosphate isomerase B [Elusimicrobiota bacterium]
MRIALGSDHGGFELKKLLRRMLEGEGHLILDVGVDAPDPVDYPDYTRKVVSEVLGGRAERGIMVCGSGIGACVAANKFPGIRAGVCHDTYSAHQGVEHDDINVLCLGGRIIGCELAYELVRAFVAAKFSNVERHARRRDKVTALEKEFQERKA